MLDVRFKHLREQSIMELMQLPFVPKAKQTKKTASRPKTIKNTQSVLVNVVNVQ